MKMNFKGSGRLRKGICQNALPYPCKPCVVPLINGDRAIIDPQKDTCISKKVYYYGTYEEGTSDLIENMLSDGGIYVDVGAYMGFTSIRAMSQINENGKVYLIEPNPWALKRLKKMYRLMDTIRRQL
ncbi:hypothetical protein [Salinibacter ruber]|uniref:hypothetical protein n=1 Tax=Salinibacter ruber TaxID=146919 RepID=UPI002169CF95|nr:hypothetical protein [Salinibacter ruber]MCS4221267.1 hypothetical protein [Salinibacter ruber]